MTRWYSIVLGSILITGGIYIYLHRQDLGLTGPSSQSVIYDASGPRLRSAPIVWTVVDRGSDGFKLEMPAGARDMQIPAYNQDGGSNPVEMIYSYPDAETSFSIAWADNPLVEKTSGGSAEATLDAARDDALARTQTTLVGESKSIRQGFPVRDFVGRNEGGGILDARLILAGHRLYMLIAAFPSASALRQEDLNRFFDSFHAVSPANGD